MEIMKSTKKAVSICQRKGIASSLDTFPIVNLLLEQGKNIIQQQVAVFFVQESVILGNK